MYLEKVPKIGLFLIGVFLIVFGLGITDSGMKLLNSGNEENFRIDKAIWSDDGKLLAFTSIETDGSNKIEIFIWDSSNEESFSIGVLSSGCSKYMLILEPVICLRTGNSFDKGDSYLYTMSFSPDNTYLAFNFLSTDLLVWNIQNHSLITHYTYPESFPPDEGQHVIYKNIVWENGPKIFSPTVEKVDNELRIFLHEGFNKEKIDTGIILDNFTFDTCFLSPNLDGFITSHYGFNYPYLGKLFYQFSPYGPHELNSSRIETNSSWISYWNDKNVLLDTPNLGYGPQFWDLEANITFLIQDLTNYNSSYIYSFKNDGSVFVLKTSTDLILWTKNTGDATNILSDQSILWSQYLIEYNNINFDSYRISIRNDEQVIFYNTDIIVFDVRLKDVVNYINVNDIYVDRGISNSWIGFLIIMTASVGIILLYFKFK